VRPLAAVLADHGATRAPGAAAGGETHLETARRESYARGRAEAEAEASAQLERLAAEAEARRLAALAEARALWTQAEGETLAQRIEAAFGALSGEIEKGVVAALRPIAERDAAQRAAQLMAQEIARLLAAGAADARPLEIAAPADLLAAIRRALRGAGPEQDDPRLVFVEAPGADAVAKVGRLRLETRLARLSDALSQED
jgi:hypothetical protein